MIRQLFRCSKHSCLSVSSWYESKCIFFFLHQRISSENILTPQCPGAGMHRNNSAFGPFTPLNIIFCIQQYYDVGFCILIWPHCLNRLLLSRSTTRNASPVWAVKCSLEMETPTRSSSAQSSTGEFKKKEIKQVWSRFFSIWKADTCVNCAKMYDSDDCPLFHLLMYPFCSGHCFSKDAVSSVGSASLLTKSPHMVALVSLPPHAGARRALTVTTDLSQEKGPLVTLTGWVSESKTRPRVNFVLSWRSSEPTTPACCVSPHLSCTRWLIVSLRLDTAALSPDLLSSVHNGDRVLEVIGIPVHNIPPDKVGLTEPWYPN